MYQGHPYNRSHPATSNIANDPGFNRNARDEFSSRRQPCDFGAGEFRHRYYQQEPIHRHTLPSAYEESNPIHDEALEFVSSVKSFLEINNCKSEILADFVSQHFKCAICLDVLIQSTVTSCGHKFCRECIETWAQIKPTCPICNQWITHKLQPYSDDQTINIVANHLPEEWHDRRRAVLERQFNTSSTASSLHAWYCASTTWLKKAKHDLWQTCKILTGFTFEGLKICGRVVVQGINFIWDYFTLPTLVKYVVIGSCLLLLLYGLDEVTNFMQYMYYTFVEYNGNIPVKQQLAAMKDRSIPSKYQEFVGPSTIFSKFIKLFYEWR